jgi:ComF family protein
LLYAIHNQNLMNVVDKVIGWLAPPVCVGCGAEGANLCLVCSEANIIPFGERCFNCGALSQGAKTCDKCRSAGFPRHAIVVTDYNGLAKRLIHVYKFGHQRVAAISIAKLMAHEFIAYNSDKEISWANYLVVPVPSASSRIRQRGFDHSALLADAVSKNLKMQSADALKRFGQSRQVGNSRKKRFDQAAENYAVSKPGLVTGRNILLIDDVVTTGATLSAAAKALRKAGAKRVDALVFAKRI